MLRIGPKESRFALYYLTPGPDAVTSDVAEKSMAWSKLERASFQHGDGFDLHRKPTVLTLDFVVRPPANAREMREHVAFHLQIVLPLARPSVDRVFARARTGVR